MLREVPRFKAAFLQRAGVSIQEGSHLPINQRSERGVIQIDGGGAKAVSVLTFVGNGVAADTFRLGFQNYALVAAYENTPYTIVVGATTAETISNIIAAILGYAGEGVVFGAGTLENADVIAAQGAGTTIDITAKTYGIGGNAIVSTEALTNGSFTGATLAGGTAFVGTVEPLVTIGGGLWLPPSMTPLDGTAAVTTMTTLGQWIIPTTGLTGIRAPITAWTSGIITVRFNHVADQLG